MNDDVSESSVVREERFNCALYACRESLHSAALLFISGTFMQLWLLHSGVSSAGIGLFNTLVQVMGLVVMPLRSGLAEKHPNALMESRRYLLPMGLCFLLYVPVFLVGNVGAGTILRVAIVVAMAQQYLEACKGILEYKLVYQIFRPARYGTLSAVSGVAIGVLMVVFSWVMSLLINAHPGEDMPYFIGMLAGCVMLVLSAWVTGRMKIVSESFDLRPRAKITARQVMGVLRRKDFSEFIVPSALRGVSGAVIASIVILARRMGIPSEELTKLAAMSSLAYITASGAYYYLDSRVDARWVCLLGSLTYLSLVAMPLCGGAAFMALYFLCCLGSTLLGWAVPVLVMRTIDPDTAGIHNAWRMTLYSVSAAVTLYVVGALADHVPPIVFLLVGAVSEVVCGVWYFVLYKRFKPWIQQKKEISANEG